MAGLCRAAIAEAVTLLALFGIAMPLKYVLGIPQAVSIIGPLHGLAFLIFLWFMTRSWAEQLINGKVALRLVLGAFIPMGGFVNERWLRRRQNKVESGDLLNH